MTDAPHSAVGFFMSSPQILKPLETPDVGASQSPRGVCASQFSFAKFKIMLEQGVVPAGIGGGPNTLRWDRDELIAHLQRRVSEQKIDAAKERATAA